MPDNRLGQMSPRNFSISSEFDNHTDFCNLIRGKKGKIRSSHSAPASNHSGMTTQYSFQSSTNYAGRAGTNGRLGGGKTTRLVTKRGKLNVEFDPEVSCWCFRYVRDIFTTSVDLPWRYHILLVCAFFLVSWVLFALVYYGIASVRGDLENADNAEWRPCFRHFYDWKSALLYSVEAQTTIGFGYRSPTEECGEAIFLLMFQTIAAKFLEAFVIATFIGKFSRPRSRGNTLLFSKRAVITTEDGELVFRFRIGDLRRKSPIIEGHVTLFMIRHYVTKEGAFFPYRVHNMNIGYDVGLDRIFLFWPLLVTHVIDSDSPLYDISRGDLALSDFEIVAVFEGIVEATGTTTQVRTSFLPSEIQWGYNFDNIILETNGRLFVDFQRFHDTRPIVGFTPNSARFDKEREEMTENSNTRGPIWEEQPPDIEKKPLNNNRFPFIESRL